ncbi:MAG: phosphatase PAP2 family protein, partial [Candidatus Methylomirabilales bacterium]
VVVAYFTIFGALTPSLGRLILKAKRSSPFLAFVAITLVIVVTIILKARLGRGTPLKGGMPSGHAALAFSLATTITFLAESPLVFLLSFILAALVSQSRFLLRIHTPLEVTLGGILGTAVAMLLFSLFR